MSQPADFIMKEYLEQIMDGLGIADDLEFVTDPVARREYFESQGIDASKHCDLKDAYYTDLAFLRKKQ